MDFSDLRRLFAEYGILGGIGFIAFAGSMLWLAIAVAAWKILGFPPESVFIGLGIFYFPGAVAFISLLSWGCADDTTGAFKMALGGVVALLTEWQHSISDTVEGVPI
ncbi:MAG: hypothetical protein QHC65_04130 [Sphingomonas sp.]|nr:hypothetical protein [Sphingomonas sp.]MDX3883586.1 hypothetical protein [Sphingomonas sp.]